MNPLNFTQDKVDQNWHSTGSTNQDQDKHLLIYIADLILNSSSFGSKVFQIKIS